MGQGYNTFVVSGYASREQVLCDLTRTICPYLPEEEAPPPIDVATVSKYQLKPPPIYKSLFLQELEDREREKIEAQLQQEEEEERRMIMVRHENAASL